MGEFAGVDPHRVRLLANRLKDLADAIAKNGSIIRTNFTKWGGTLDLGQLARQAAQVGQDARDMALRADEALNLLDGRSGPVMSSPGKADWVTIPWDTKDINATQEAQQEATNLKKALDNPNDPQSRATITDIAQSLTDHQGDSAYMAAFINSGGMDDAARVAHALHQEDAAHNGTVLTTDSQAILAQFGSAVASAAKSGQLHDFKAFTQTPDLWSSAMLFKYGPDGKAYGDGQGAQLLAAVTGAVLDAHQAGTLNIPVPDSRDASPDQRKQIQGWLAEFDPACALMDRGVQNGLAPRLVLGGPNGSHYAQELINNNWQTPGDSYSRAGGGKAALELPPVQIPGIDLSGHVATFLQSATTAPLGGSGDAQLSAQALVNVVQANAKFTQDNPKGVLPKNIREAFVSIADAHTPDFAYSARYGFEGKPQLVSGAWLAQVDPTSLDSFLRQAMHDPQDAGRLKGCFDAKISAAVGQTIQDHQPWLENMASLYGMVQHVEGENSFDKAELVAAKKAENQMLMSILATGLGAIPGPGEGVGKIITQIAKPMISMSNTVAGYKYPGGDPAKALMLNDDDFIKDKHWVQVPVVQGLIDAGQVHPPANASWYQNGHIIPNADFGTWVQENATAVGDDGKPILYSGKSLDQWINDAVGAVGAEQ